MAYEAAEHDCYQAGARGAVVRWLSLRREGFGKNLPSGAGTSDNVKVVAWPGDIVEVALGLHLQHQLLEDEET